MKNPSVHEFFQFAGSIADQQILTAGGRARFRVEVTKEGLCYWVTSTGKGRKQKRERIEKILAQHRETGSVKPGDYKDLTVHASYALGILKHYFERHSSKA